MSPRRAVLMATLIILLGGALAGAWHSTQPARSADPAYRLAAELRCPACQGESVADSRSPIAAAMREVIRAQLAERHSIDEIRAYLVRRYGPDVLAVPPARGPGVLLWLTPALALLASLAAAARAARRSRRAYPAPETDGRPALPECSVHRAGPASRRPRSAGRGARIWNISAACLLGIVGAVALAAQHLPAQPDPAEGADPVPGQLALARSMEEQGRYDAAAEVYQSVLRLRPADGIRLRMAFTLVRAGRAAEAESLAEQVLISQPDAPEALLILGLAQWEVDPVAGVVTLRRFLGRAPDHDAAAEVRRLVEDMR